ncbi:MIP/aquaporin family protein [Saccharicrinis aurantiacus]|uniref:MIP/aquaporin family protein n=1 Tax=Saccharicrinis aurantiacus TaxID=1849719 RepID=UPI0024925AF6|nr:MIP/aquaporin family protein [Saccharicrinis aurantiacus]
MQVSFYKQDFIGELIGTFMLIVFGCGAIAVATTLNGYEGIFQVAMIWGLSVTLGIYTVRHLSCAHFNPAITLAMVFSRRMSWKKVPSYFLGQFIGAFLGALMVYILFSAPIADYESKHNIVRGSIESVKTARIFSAFYIYGDGTSVITLSAAMITELFGTFMLMLLVLALTEGCHVGRPGNNLSPIIVGLVVASIICLVGPLTQAGLNPARDLAPRLVTWIMGWGEASMQSINGGFLLVYTFSPILGAAVATVFYDKVLKKSMMEASSSCICKDED